MNRKTILKISLGIPTVLAALVFAFSQTGSAEGMLSPASRPEVPETGIPGNMKRIVSSEGFFYEDFESMTDAVLTDGWVTTATPGLPDGKWGVGSLGTDGKAMAGTSGYTYAYILGNRDKNSDIPHDAWLFSPGVELKADREYKIEFCTYMGGSPTTGEELTVYLMSGQSPDAEVKEIDFINDSSGTWRLQSYSYIPETDGVYYLGFQCTSPVMANATLIDDVKISEGPTSGFFGLAGVDVGVTDMRHGKISAEYEVINRGTEPLTLTFKSASPEINVVGLPITVKYRQSGTFTVEFTPSKPGKFEGELVVTTNDPAHPEVTLAVLVNVLDVPLTGYAYEDFEKGFPKGWIFSAGAVNSDYYGGHNDARSFYTRAVYCLTEDGPVGITTHYVELGDDPEFSFWYKLTDCDLMGVASAPTPSEIPVMQVLVSTDNGATYEPVWELGQDSGLLHNPSADFQQIRIPLKDYAGQCARVKLEIWGDVNPLEHDFIILVDDVAIGTPHQTDLRVLNLSGAASVVSGTPAVARVTLENLGCQEVSSCNVAIIDEQGTSLGESPVASIKPGEKQVVNVEWRSDRKGSAAIKAVIKTDGDSDLSNNVSELLAVDLIEAANTKVTVGDGADEYLSSVFPLNLHSRETASQTIYYANELGIDRCTISSITYTTLFENDHFTEPFEVFVGESAREDYSDKGWESLQNLTKVYEGQIFVPAARHEMVIPFSTPYEYKGGNLIVMVRKMTDYFIVNKSFLVHTGEPLRTTFCSYLQRGKMIPDEYSDRQQDQGYAHAAFNIVKAPHGLISGVVTDANGPVGGVRISVEGTSLYTMTDSQGHYTLPEVAVGDRALTASKYGYYPSAGNAVVVSEGSEHSKDISLSPYPRTKLEGTVTSVDGQPIQDVRVYLEGYADYKATTDLSGHYVIEDIYGDTGFDYVVRTESSYFEPTRQKITVKEDMNHDITLGNSHLRVHDLRVSGVDNALRLTWDAPIAEFKHDNGVPVDYMGWNHGHSECAVFTTYHKNLLVKEVRWYTSRVYGPHTNFNVMIFGLGKDGYPNPKDILYMAKNVDYVDEGWSSHILPVAIEVEGCAVGVSCDGLLGLGRTDVDENHPFTPLMHFFSGDSYNYELGISDFTSYMPAHPMLRLGADYLGDLDGTSRKKISRPNCRYDVYRLSGQDWKNRTFIGSTESLEFEDLEFKTLPQGSYRYAVVAVYPTGESDDVISTTVKADGSGIATVNAGKPMISYDSASGHLLISNHGDVKNIEVVSLEGMVVRSSDGSASTLDISDLPGGFYIARVVLNDNKMVSSKFMK